jgi:anti-sigma factor RsiW
VSRSGFVHQSSRRRAKSGSEKPRRFSISAKVRTTLFAYRFSINVFVWRAAEADTPIDARSIRGFHVRHWTRDAMSFWAVSDLNDVVLV